MSVAVQLHDEWMELAGKLEAQRQKSQDFFAAYVSEIRSPAYGDGAKIFAESMVVRAEQAGLYVRPKEAAST